VQLTGCMNETSKKRLGNSLLWFTLVLVAGFLAGARGACEKEPTPGRPFQVVYP
jgi:hypothetical protein